ncbi:MAG: UDP-3-O-(3-hydroxymyristoyl)glucosamine N-acyltransferase [Candidatus Aminicenantes bacterium]|nr:UDP-3-O-(3-hydroxymyristoyl)glucosamine N-acyltransferase [Candidatus Aminicenantes bacterium]
MNERMKKLPEPPLPPFTLAELAKLLNCPFEGEGKTEISGVSSLEDAQKGDLTFCAGPKFRKQLERTVASAVIVPLEEKFNKIPVIKSKNPYLTFVKAIGFFFKPYVPLPGIHPQAVVSPTAKIGKNVSIGALTYIGDEVEIGEGSVIFPLVSIYPKVKIGREVIIHSHVSIREEVNIGNRVLIHNGVIIGSDGFGYLQTEEGRSIKIPQKGTVIIEDDVEIGANTTIDRAALTETRIQKGVKIDNLVQIAHSVDIGAHSILAAQTGIAGSTKVGQKVIMGGQVGVTDHITIGDNVIIAAKSGVTKSVPANTMVAGVPHLEITEWRKAWASIPHLYELLREIRKLKKRIEELEKK